MKKLLYLGALAILTACTSNGYTINGEISGVNDGDSIFLMELNGGQINKLQGTVINDGKFQLKGVQDEPAIRYLVYHFRQNDGQSLEFFLENGTINVKMNDETQSVWGTPNNDANQAVMNEMQELQQKMDPIYEALASDEITDEQREAYTKQTKELEDEYMQIMTRGIRKNINLAAGIDMLKKFYYYMETPQLAEIVNLIPEQFSSDETIVRIKEQIKKLTATSVGQKFTDFEMNDPAGNPIKLSDYAGNGKVVLVDFWASWCGPCRQEMPNVVKVYEQYKNKGFEIVGVSLDQTADAWKKGIADLNMTWPQMSDLKYWKCKAATIYGVDAIPHTVLIDKDGTIIERNLRGEMLYERIAELLD